MDYSKLDNYFPDDCAHEIGLLVAAVTTATLLDDNVNHDSLDVLNVEGLSMMVYSASY